MEIIKNKIELGVKTPFKILHITDCHLTPVGDLDNERKHVLAGKRFKTFGEEKCLEYYLEITKYGRDNSLPMICTGDLIDFTSYEAFDVLDRECKLNNLIFAVGNHEFSRYVGEAKEDFFYKMQSYTSVQSAIHSPIDFASMDLLVDEQGPALGQDTAEVLEALGYSQEQIKEWWNGNAFFMG